MRPGSMCLCAKFQVLPRVTASTSALGLVEWGRDWVPSHLSVFSGELASGQVVQAEYLEPSSRE